MDRSGKVTDGLNTLNNKTGEMQKGIGELRDGSEKVTGGLNKLVSKSGELKNREQRIYQMVWNDWLGDKNN